MQFGDTYISAWYVVPAIWLLVLLVYLLVRKTNKKPDQSLDDKRPEHAEDQIPTDIVEPDSEPTAELEPAPDFKREGFLRRLRSGAKKSSNAITGDLVAGTAIDEDLLEELEMALLGADVGIEATTQVITNLTKRLSKNELSDVAAVKLAMRDELLAIITPSSQPLDLDAVDTNGGPFVLLMVGVNGVGKTTTIGKLAKRFQAEGKSVMLAAGDTFRAAAVDQLKVWGERNDVAVVSQGEGADSASVIFDALQSAKSKGVDVVIADTAGRLHTSDNLMAELEKVKRVVGKFDATAPHETMIVIDATTGQNGMVQVEQFDKVVGLTGISLTKLDGTAKGGVIFAIAKKLGVPVRYIGVGEAAEDLGVFEAEAFVDALLGTHELVADEPA